MKRLIISELKKLWKGRKLWIGVVCIIILSIYASFQTYYSSQEDIASQANKVKNELGETVSVSDLIHDRDKIIHQYAGHWSKEKENKIIQDLNNKLEKYPRNQLDDQAMQEEYGKNYDKYLKKEESIGLSEKDIEEITNEIGKIPNYKELDNNILLDRIYTNDPYREYLSYIYTGAFTYHEGGEMDVFKEWNAYLISPTFESIKEDNWEYSHIVQNKNLSEKQQQVYQDYLIQQVNQLPQTYDSGLPNEYLLSTLSQAVILPLFIIMILLANVFSIERECKTDQIIYPTQATQHKITIAKLLSGYISAIGIMLIPIVIVCILSMFIFPIHDLNVMVTFLTLNSIDVLIPTTYLILFKNAILLVLMSAISIATLTMLLSYFTKQKFIVIIVIFVFMVMGYITPFINIPVSLYSLLTSSHPLYMSSYQCYFALQSVLFGNPLSTNIPYLFTDSMIIPIRWLVIGTWSLFTVLTFIFLSKHSKKTNLTL